jgi:hypothetical protein
MLALGEDPKELENLKQELRSAFGPGDSLMNRAFGSDKQTPVIQFNSLQSDPERDEQKRHHVPLQRGRWPEEFKGPQ